MDRIENYLSMLARDKNARRGFLQSMGPYAQMPEKAMLTNIRSCCNQISPAEKRSYLNSLQALSRNKTFQSKKAQKRIGHLTNILSANQSKGNFLAYVYRPGPGYARPLAVGSGPGYGGLGSAPGYGYGYGNRGIFGRGLLGWLVILFLLGAII